MKTRAMIVAAVALCLAPAAAYAQGGSVTGGAAGVNVVSGGIGEEAQQELRAREKEFNLKLVFTLVEGNYLSDVNVAIADARGQKVVEHFAEGPFFLARLPAGQYTVSATYEGKTVSRKLQVGKSLRTEYMRWPSNPESDTTLAREGDERPAGPARTKPASPSAAGSGKQSR